MAMTQDPNEAMESETPEMEATEDESTEAQPQGRPFGVDAPEPTPDERPLGEIMMDSPDQQATPEEQAQYTSVVAKALKFIHGRGRESVLKQMGKAKSPAEAVGRVAANIGRAINQSAKEAGKPLMDGVLLHAGTEIVQELIEFGAEAGIFQFNDDSEAQQEAEDGFLYAVKNFGEAGLADGSINKSEIEDSKRIMQQGIESEAKYGNPAVKNSIRAAIQHQMAQGRMQGAQQGAMPQGPVQNPQAPQMPPAAAAGPQAGIVGKARA